MPPPPSAPRASSPSPNERYHDPLRLLAVIEAPLYRIEEIVGNHRILQHLFDNGWVNLVALDPRTGAFHPYLPGLAWERLAVDPGRGRKGVV